MASGTGIARRLRRGWRTMFNALFPHWSGPNTVRDDMVYFNGLADPDNPYSKCGSWRTAVCIAVDGKYGLYCCSICSFAAAYLVHLGSCRQSCIIPLINL
jgi:hypothetical protein